jgi:hypothetical protein
LHLVVGEPVRQIDGRRIDTEFAQDGAGVLCESALQRGILPEARHEG